MNTPKSRTFRPRFAHAFPGGRGALDPFNRPLTIRSAKSAYRTNPGKPSTRVDRTQSGTKHDGNRYRNFFHPADPDAMAPGPAEGSCRKRRQRGHAEFPAARSRRTEVRRLRTDGAGRF